MRIKFGEISISESSKKHIQDCLDNNHITMGSKTTQLENMWSKLFGYHRTIAVSSGTSACMAANMMLYDFGAVPGDEVIVPALSFIATANSVRAAGLVPVFVDIKDDLMIDEKLIEAKITPKTRAIMAVTLMGKPPKMDVIRRIADRNHLMVIVDNCEGHGCRYKGKYVNEWADVVAYSCYAAHILFSCELGLLGTKDFKIAESLESIRTHGRKPGSLYFDHIRYGLNLKPTDLHASIGLGNVENFWEIFNIRKENWLYLKRELDAYKDLFWFSDEDEGSCTSPHGFSITVKPNSGLDCVGLTQALDVAEIDWKRNFGSMATQHQCFAYLGHKLGEFPKAEYIGNNGIHIGVHQFLSKDDLRRIVETVITYINSKTPQKGI